MLALSIYEDLGLVVKFFILVRASVILFIILNYFRFFYLGLGLTIKYGVVGAYSLVMLIII